MRWFVGIAALLVLASCAETMDVPTPVEELDGVYRVTATPRDSDCDVHSDLKASYLITLSINDDCCEMCGVEGSWNESTKTATIQGESGSLSITYMPGASADEQRPVFRGLLTELDPTSGCNSTWTVVAKKLAYE